MDAGAAVLEPSDPERVIHAHRIGCLVHVLHLFVNAGMRNLLFMGRLGKWSWHEWPKKHLVGLLGSLWYIMSRSDVSTTTQKQYTHVVHGGFAIVWDGKFDKPTETRWMVTWGAAAVPEGRWDRVLWFASDWEPSKLLGNPFMYYWHKPDVMLSNPLTRVHCCYYCTRREGAVIGFGWCSSRASDEVTVYFF